MLMFSKRDKTNRRQKGQSMTEYIIIVSLIAVALITVITVFGGNIKRLWQGAIEAVKTGSTESAKTYTDKMEDASSTGDKQSLPDLGGEGSK